MSTPPAFAPVSWTEPTRRLNFSPRFSYDGRYGASLTALVLGGYLLLNTNTSQLALALSGRSSFPTDQTAFLLGQFVFALAVVLFALAIAPATSGRRVIAVVLVLVLVLIWLMLVAARLSGSTGPLPFATAFVTPQSFIVPLVTALGWLIVRERPWPTYLFLLLAIIGGAAPVALVFNAIPSLIAQMLIVPLAGVLAVGIAWLARAVAGLVGRSHTRDDLVDQPPAA